MRGGGVNERPRTCLSRGMLSVRQCDPVPNGLIRLSCEGGGGGQAHYCRQECVDAMANSIYASYGEWGGCETHRGAAGAGEQPVRDHRQTDRQTCTDRQAQGMGWPHI